MGKGRGNMRRRGLYAVLTLLVLILIYWVFGALVLPRIVRPIIEREGTKALKRPVTLERLRVRPFALAVELRGLRIGEKEGADDFVRVERIYVNAELASAWKRAPVLREIRVEGPRISLVRLTETEFNFSDLIPPPSDEPEGPPQAFSLNNIRLQDGLIRFEDRVTGTSHALSRIRLDLPFVSREISYRDVFLQPAFSAELDGRELAVTGRTKPFADSLETHMEAHVQEIPLADFLVYAPIGLNGSIPTANLDADLYLSYAQGQRGVSSVSLTGSVAVHDIAVLDKGGTAVLELPKLGFDDIELKLPENTIRLKRLLLQEPDVRISMDKEGKLNVTGLFPAGNEEAPEQEKAAKTETEPGPRIYVEEARIAGARVNFRDETPSRPFETTVVMADITVGEFSNVGERSASYSATLFTERNESIAVRGLFSLEAMECAGTLEVLSARPLKYAPYYEVALPFEMSDSSLDLHCAYEIGIGEGTVRVSDLSLTLSGLTLRHREQELTIEAPKFSVMGGSFDLTGRTVLVQEARIEGPSAAIGWGGETSAAATAVGPVSTPAEAQPAEAAAAPGWDVALNHFAVVGGKATATDRTLSRPARFGLDQLRVDMENVTLRPNSPAKLDLACRISEQGRLTVKGPVTADPPSADLEISLSDLPLRMAQPYLDDASSLLLSEGRLAVKGKASALVADAPAFRFDGAVSVTGLSLLEKLGAAPVARWDTLAFDGVAVKGMPMAVNVGGIRLEGPEVDLLVNPDGTTNFALALQAPGASEMDEAEKPEAPETAVKSAETGETETAPSVTMAIAGIAIKDGLIRVTDRSVQPNYLVEVTRFGGSVSEVRWPETGAIKVALAAMIANNAPFNVKADINQPPTGLEVAVESVLEGMNLSPLTPYSVKAIGFPIEKGKLSLEVGYSIRGNALDARNGVLIDQLTLGDRIEESDAPRLPVKLALALLTDRRGQIKLNVPLSGSLDDPEFSIGRIVLQVLRNLIEKAATAPFDLLASAFGGGEELSAIDFAPGRSALDDVARARLDRLAEALYDRPKLKLEIGGSAAAEEDRAGLVEVRFEELLKEAKRREMPKEERQRPLDEITIGPDEVVRYIAAAYKDGKFAKPRNFIGVAKDLPTDEMKALIVQNIAVTDEDLRQLAYRRAQAAHDYLLGTEKVTAERLFLVEPDLSEKGAAKAKFSLGQ